uniref:Uncharacterized protein n=1 Tax=Oryza brachyantha TaxID=4533 RepID=J3MKN3_ORYBR
MGNRVPMPAAKERACAIPIHKTTKDFGTRCEGPRAFAPPSSFLGLLRTSLAKELSWTELQKVPKYLENPEIIAKEYTPKIMGVRWRSWKSELNKKCVQRNRTPFEDYP